VSDYILKITQRNANSIKIIISDNFIWDVFNREELIVMIMYKNEEIL
jgi:hypothetical protein